MTQAIENSSSDQSFREAWDSIEPGSRASKGVYSVWKTLEGDLLISYRPEDLADDEPDQAMPIPGQAINLLMLASEGKLSPMELLTQLPKIRKLWS